MYLHFLTNSAIYSFFIRYSLLHSSYNTNSASSSPSRPTMDFWSAFSLRPWNIWFSLDVRLAIESATPPCDAIWNQNHTRCTHLHSVQSVIQGLLTVCVSYWTNLNISGSGKWGWCLYSESNWTWPVRLGQKFLHDGWGPVREGSGLGPYIGVIPFGQNDRQTWLKKLPPCNFVDGR